MKYYHNQDMKFQLGQILNGGIEFADNMRGAFVEFETSEGENIIDHNLGYRPVGFIIIYRNGQVELWDSGTQWTQQTMYLQSSAPNVTVRLFVM